MKTVKVKFVGFWNNFCPEDSTFYKILSLYYKPIICDNPDYIICGCFEPYYEYLRYPQIRIMICGENYTPDFNFVDYAICRYPIKFLDRCFYEPGCLRPFPDAFDLQKDRNFTSEILKEKKVFCNFICSHESENNIRGDFFKKLCEYKKVDSVGRYLNNTGVIVDRNNGTKRLFQKKCKFSLCFESTKNEGFFTEKLTDAFLSNTIPIYYGSSTVKDIFNKNAYIDVSDYNSFDDVIRKIVEIDNNDELFLKILNEPTLTLQNSIDTIYNDECLFIKHIFDQSIEQAYRRSKVYAPSDYEKYIVKNSDGKKNKSGDLFSKIIKKMNQKINSFN